MKIIAGCVIAISMAVTWLSSPLKAKAALASQPQSEICMAQTGSDGVPMAIILPPEFRQTMSAKGFAELPCEQAFRTHAEREAWRNTICEAAANWREEQLRTFERLRGERPAVLCAMAEAVSAPWERAARN